MFTKKIIFCDLNESLVKKVEILFNSSENKWGLEFLTHNGDIFKYQKENGGLIATASNPYFSMGGGLDLQIAKRFPEEVKDAKEFKQTENLFFTITVNKKFKATRKIVRRALMGSFAFSKKDIIISGFGTAIGGMSEEEFIICLQQVFDINY